MASKTKQQTRRPVPITSKKNLQNTVHFTLVSSNLQNQIYTMLLLSVNKSPETIDN